MERQEQTRTVDWNGVKGVFKEFLVMFYPLCLITGGKVAKLCCLTSWLERRRFQQLLRHAFAFPCCKCADFIKIQQLLGVLHWFSLCFNSVKTQKKTNRSEAAVNSEGKIESAETPRFFKFGFTKLRYRFFNFRRRWFQLKLSSSWFVPWDFSTVSMQNQSLCPRVCV